MQETRLSFVWALAAAGACLAQTPNSQPFFFQAAPPPSEDNVFFARGTGTVAIVKGQFSFENKVVKGQPYTADAVTETTQVLSDGNRITRKETVTVARDSEGRTRREQVLSGVGPWSTSTEAQKIVFINDPVAQVNYVLEPDHTARKISLARSDDPEVEAKLKAESTAARQTLSVGFKSAKSAESFKTEDLGAQMVEGSVGFKSAKSAESFKTEDLGAQMVEGVQAQGTRDTVTIPAGDIGNEKPIETTSERWYSNDLQAMVMTKSSDPRTGETVFRLTNIQRSEPPASMFEVPSGYKIEEGKGAFRIQIQQKN